MFRENDEYGHSRVLALYAGFTSPPPIWGMLQHGWNLGTGFTPYRPPRGIPLFVWNCHNLEHAGAAGLRNVQAIGAPFVYLVRHLNARPSPEAKGTIVYPFHSWERAEIVGDHAAYAGEIVARETKPLTICLYWREYEDPSVRNAYEATGARVICHGKRRTPGFLEQQLSELVKHRRVVTNRVGTALWYGGVLGLEVEVYGPAMGVHRMAEGLAFDREQRARWPELFGGPLDGVRARVLSERELGCANIMSQGELRETLGWNRFRRAVGPVLRSAVRRAQDLRARVPWPNSEG